MDFSTIERLFDIRFLKKSEITYEVMIKLILSCIVDLRKQKEVLVGSSEEVLVSHWLLVIEKILQVCMFDMKEKLHPRICHRRLTVAIDDFIEKKDDREWLD